MVFDMVPRKGKKTCVGGGKSLVFCPSWNLIQKFGILEDKKQTEGEGRKADEDGGFFLNCEESKLTQILRNLRLK